MVNVIQMRTLVASLVAILNSSMIVKDWGYRLAAP